MIRFLQLFKDGSTFRNTISFNQPLNNWNTISATSMNNMFNNAQNFNQDISNLNVINVSNYVGFRTNCPLTDQNIRKCRS